MVEGELNHPLPANGQVVLQEASVTVCLVAVDMAGIHRGPELCAPAAAGAPALGH
jgi:hypothetical protein